MESLQEAASWFGQNLLWLLIIGGILVLANVYSGPLVDTVVRRTLRATEGDFSGADVEDHELKKGKVVAADRWRVSTAVRLRLDTALRDAGIELNRLALPVGRTAGGR